MHTKQDKIRYLFELLAKIDDPDRLEDLFDDLCTVKEMENMAERIYAARLLMEGMTYAQVMEKSSISSATLSRVSRCVQYGKGYKKVLK